MKKVKLAVLFLVFLGLFVDSKAQVNEQMYKLFKKESADSMRSSHAKKRDNIINTADFIFEGRVVQNGIIETDTGIIACDLMRIEKIYRGHSRLKYGFIEVVYKTENDISTSGQNIIVFCKKSAFNKSFYNPEIFDNKVKMEVIGSLINVSPKREEMTGLYHLNFSTYSKARSYLSKYQNIRIEDKSNQKESDSISDGKNKKQNEINLNKYFQLQDSLIKRNNEKKNRKSLKSATTLTTDLYFTIANVKNVAGAATAERWLQFDIQVKSNSSGIYLDNAIVHLEYPTGVLNVGGSFYSNSFSNNNVTASRGSTFSTSNYDEVSIMDISGSKLGFQIGTTAQNTLNNTVNRSIITTNYQTLMTVKLKIKNDYESTTLTLSFNEPNYQFISSYSTNATSTNNSTWFLFDNPIFENLASVPNSPSPIINSITSTATAGTGTIVVITGSNFGDANFPSTHLTPANHKVRFKSADFQGFNAIQLIKRLEYCEHLNNSDYILWTPTRIEIRLPSFIWHNLGTLTPGSGNFFVRNDWGKETESLTSQTINIQYGLHSRVDNSLSKHKIHIPRRNCVDGIKFRIDPALMPSTNLQAYNAIDNAFKTWSSALGITVDFEKDAAGNILTATGSAIDGMNVIYYNNAYSGMGTNIHNGGSEPTGLYTCGSNSGSSIAGLKDVDITINNTVSWNYDLAGSSITGAPFYDAILHELGHALGLTHSLEPNDLMNPTLVDSPTSSQRRTLSTGNGFALTGIGNLINQSKNTTWSCDNLETLLSPPSANCMAGSKSGSVLNDPILIGTLNIGNNYSNTLDNFSYGNDYTGSNNQPSDDIFYKFTLSANSIVSISLCNSAFDTYLHLLNGTGSWIASNDDNCGSRSKIVNTLNAGTYYVVVEGYGISSGSITTEITVSAVPVNIIGALISNPINIGTLSNGSIYSDTKNNSTQNSYGNEYSGYNNQSSDDVFYKFNLSSNADVSISLCNSILNDTYVHLLDGTGSWIASNDDYCNYKSKIVKSLNAGTYYVVVEGFGNSSGSITTEISVSSVAIKPIGALFSNPIIVGALNIGSVFTDTKDNSPTNNYGNDFTAYTNQGSDDIFYRFTINTPASLQISTCSSDNTNLNDTYIHLLDINGNLIASNDDFCDFRSGIYRNQEAGTYYIVVEGYTLNYGKITTSISVGELVKSAEINSNEAISKEEIANSKIMVFPNPANKIVNITGYSLDASIQVSDINGKMIFKQRNVQSKITSLDVHSYPKGIYLIIINDGKHFYRNKLTILN